jgi:hypothetical protein
MIGSEIGMREMHVPSRSGALSSRRTVAEPAGQTVSSGSIAVQDKAAG